MTNDIDSNGYWTVDDYEALMGLAAYRYLAHAVVDSEETRWATDEYHSLLAAVTRTLNATIHRYALNYLPCSMVEPNTANRCNNPEDANWAAPFLFGRWAWNAPLFGSAVERARPRTDRRDVLLRVRPARGTASARHVRRLPGDYYSSGYNAGYGSGGLASTSYRDQGSPLRVHGDPHPEWAVLVGWESSSAPVASFPVDRKPSRCGTGFLAACVGHREREQGVARLTRRPGGRGTLIVGRGVPDDWLGPGKPHLDDELPHHEQSETRRHDRLRRSLGPTDVARFVSVRGVLLQLPVFVHNIAFDQRGNVTQKTGTVTLSGGAKTVTVGLLRGL